VAHLVNRHHIVTITRFVSVCNVGTESSGSFVQVALRHNVLAVEHGAGTPGRIRFPDAYTAEIMKEPRRIAISSTVGKKGLPRTVAGNRAVVNRLAYAPDGSGGGGFEPIDEDAFIQYAHGRVARLRKLRSHRPLYNFG
jgi:hypothetical protein